MNETMGRKRTSAKEKALTVKEQGWKRDKEQVANALEILRELSGKLQRKPSEEEFVERLAKESEFRLLEEEELRKLARRTVHEGQKQDNKLKKEAKAKQDEAKERRYLVSGCDDASLEDALARPVYMGAYGLGARPWWTEIDQDRSETPATGKCKA